MRWPKLLIGRRERSQPPPDADHIVLAAVNSADRPALRAALEGSGWTLVWADDCRHACTLLSVHPLSTVICDRDLPGADWREALRAMLSTPAQVCVILASRVADEYLWREVIRRGGFDIVAKPFQREEVLRTLGFALNHWKTRRSAGAL